MIFDTRLRRLLLTEIGGEAAPEMNLIDIDGKTYYLKPINKNYKFSKGGNSTVFTIFDPNSEEKERAIKICNIRKITKSTPEWLKKRYGRFITEIEALKKVKEENVISNVVEIDCDGFIEVDGQSFPYYVMEKADTDLGQYMLSNALNVDIQERVKLCIDIYKGLISLHNLDFYHRDIKPDNILLFYLDEVGDNAEKKFIWKVGDLGLVAHRDNDLDDLGEKIGPIGWLTPEAMNKYLTEKFELGLDCVINDESDIFQLGKLFWFVFEYNVPIGQLKIEDFSIEIPHKAFIFQIIFEMLQYPKHRRINKVVMEENLQLLSMEFGL